MRLPIWDRVAHEVAYEETLERLESEIEMQMTRQGYYVPCGPVCMVVARKLRTDREGVDRGR
jgi:hypothetical protein